MKKIVIMMLLSICFLLTGCDILRFEPTQKQKQNAWLHNKTATAVVQIAKDENTSEKLQALTQLSQLQSRDFTTYYGLPKQLPPAETDQQILSQANFQLARSALTDAANRPDVWQVADTGLELAIGIAAILGGVYGTRAVRFLNLAKTKSKALKEIIQGNEFFKRQNQDSTQAFKQAHKSQSPQTRQIVNQIKNA
jgi:hypothetical protein